MKKRVLYAILAIAMISSVGCAEKTASNEDSKNNDKGTVVSYETSQETEDKVDKYVSAECTWAYDVTDPTTVLENTDYFVKVRIKTKEKTKYFVKNKIMPSSTYNVEVLDVISPENATLPKNIKIVVNGGVVSMEEYVNTLDAETKEKAQTDTLSKKELKELIMISDESYYELTQGNEYYICLLDLTQDENYKGYYGMPEGGYDVFQESNGQYINVLTQKTLDK